MAIEYCPRRRPSNRPIILAVRKPSPIRGHRAQAGKSASRRIDQRAPTSITRLLRPKQLLMQVHATRREGIDGARQVIVLENQSSSGPRAERSASSQNRLSARESRGELWL